MQGQMADATSFYGPGAVSDEQLVALFPGELLSWDNSSHYRARLHRQLVVNRCSTCGVWHQPARPICPSCWSSDVVATPVSGRGTIHLLVWLHQGPPTAGVEYTHPYPVVVVELDEQPGLRVTGTVKDTAHQAFGIGSRVELDWGERSGVPLAMWRCVDDNPAGISG
jgi:uncharacterized OB-fold protein